MTGFAAALMAIVMIAALVLTIAGVRLAMSVGDRKRGLLMLAAAAVLVGNVLIWTI